MSDPCARRVGREHRRPALERFAAVAVLGMAVGSGTASGAAAQASAAPPGAGAVASPGGAAAGSLGGVGRGDTLRSYGTADYTWRLESLGGERLTLERYRGRTLFINVWASWCAPCVAELDGVQELYDSLRIGEGADSSIAVVLITPDRRSAAERFIRRRGLTVPAYIEARRTPSAFGLRALPTTYIVAPDGDIVLAHLGAAKWNTAEVRAFLRALALRR